MDRALSRRDLIRSAAALGLLGGTGCASLPGPRGELVEVLPFTDDGNRTRGVRLVDGLDGRLCTDLSGLEGLAGDRPVIPTEDFFIRTFAPPSVDVEAPIRLSGHVERPAELDQDWLRERSRDQGQVLLECSGNPRAMAFGLLGAATWGGVELLPLLEQAVPTQEAWGVRVVGYDHGASKRGSIPGASWLFSFEELRVAGAFLATTMNDAPLSPDHGFPVRLVVPGSYGCCCIKWVHTLELVGPDEPPTSQMVEFAGRSLQSGIHELARDFRSPTIPHTAMPIRVERWRVKGRDEYRIIGLEWGGDGSTDTLQICANGQGLWFPVHRVGGRSTQRTWSLWTHTWRPLGAGPRTICLRYGDSELRQAKLRHRIYDRTVELPSS
jgi:DMSO/TMAO reductase YedYZ molybdopterin-dependent catalytic subunit